MGMRVVAVWDRDGDTTERAYSFKKSGLRYLFNENDVHCRENEHWVSRAGLRA